MPASEEAIERRRIRDRAKSKRKRAAERAERLAIQKSRPVISKGSPSYRRKFPKLPEMTKSESREMLRRAVLNTAALSS